MAGSEDRFAQHFRRRWEERGDPSFPALELARLLVDEVRTWRETGHSQVIDRVQASLDNEQQWFFRFLVNDQSFYVLVDLEHDREWLLTVYNQPMMQKMKASRRLKKVWRSRAGTQGSNARKRWGR
jgi:hypothetical protein